jgi:glutathione S-transferase
MKLYYDPISTTSRPLMMFAAEHTLPITWELISLFQGQHKTPAFLAINANGTVPCLVEGTFVLTESSAILKYLADLAESPAYPRDLRERAKVNAAMDWFMTNFHTALGSNLAYPLLYPAEVPHGPRTLAEVTAKGAEATRRSLDVLDGRMIGSDRNYVAGPELTIADYVGGSMLVLAEAIDLALTPWPNVRRWIGGLRARPSWDPTFAAVNGLLSAMRPAA